MMVRERIGIICPCSTWRGRRADIFMRAFWTILLFVALLLAGGGTARAQYSLAVTPGVNVPIDGGSGSVGIGRDPALDGRASIYREPDGKRLVYGGTVGVQRYLSEPNPAEPDFSYELLAVPITAGVRYYLLNGALRPFIGVDAGLNFLRYKVIEEGRRDDISNTGLTVIPGIGFRLRVIGRFGIEAGALYQHTLHSSVERGSRSQLSGSMLSSWGLHGGLSYTFDLQ
jgi:hypothetical protein